MHSVFLYRRVLAGSALAAFTFLTGPIATANAEDKAGDAIVAKVNGKSITEAYMTLAENELGKDLGDLPPEVKRRALAEYLIDNELFAEAAKAQKLGDTPEFQNKLNYFKQRLLRQEYFEKTLKGEVNENEAKDIYEKRVADLKPEEEVSARHILVDSEKKAKELRAKIVAGADFAQVAKENSSDRGTKDLGGSLGYFTQGQMVPEFDTAVFKMKKGEISEPVKTNFGWHIIKLDDRRRKEPPSFEDVKDTIMNSLAMRNVQQKAAELRKKATVDYVDAGIKKQVEEQKAKQAEAAAKKDTKKDAGKAEAAPKK